MPVTYLILPDNEANKTFLSQFNIRPKEAIKTDVNESCRICLGEENLSSLYGDNEYFESLSISDAIVDCFSVRVSPDVKLSSFICSECAIKVQDARTFKHTILKGEKVICIYSRQMESSDESVIKPETKPFLPALIEGLNTLPSGIEANEDEINCAISPVASTTKIPPLKKETILNCHLRASPALDSMMKDKKNKPFLSILRKLLNKTSNKNSCLVNKNKKNKSISPSTVLSRSHLKMNVEHTYPPEEKVNETFMSEHNYTKSSIKVTTENGTALESASESIPADSSSKTDEEPLAEPKIKKHSNRSAADSMEKWWSRSCGPPYECKLCERSYGARYSAFYRHVRTHFRKNHPCTICGKRIFSNQLRLHMRSHTNERPFLCQQCPARFITLAKLKRHLICHTGEKPYICEVCGKGFAQNSTLQMHIVRHNKSSNCVCEICGITLRCSSYRNHKSRCHREDKTAIESNERFPCDQCNTVFSKLQSLTRHYRVHNSITNKCKICDATFEESYSYEVHSFIHEIQSYETDDADKSFHCKFCVNICNTKNDLEKHVLTHMNNPYKCKNCDQSFPTKPILTAHVQKYCDSRLFSCTDCGKAFRTSAALYQHKKIHTGVKTHRCEVCDRAFLQSHQLTYHMITHTGEKKYVCQYCGKAFGLNGSLTVHVRRHTGETPYACKVCNKGFYDSSSCKKHMRARHRIELMADNASSTAVNATKEDSTIFI